MPGKKHVVTHRKTHKKTGNRTSKPVNPPVDGTVKMAEVQRVQRKCELKRAAAEAMAQP